MSKPRFYTVAQFCAAFGIKRTTCYLERKAGRLPFLNFGPRKVVISDEAAEAWAAARFTS